MNGTGLITFIERKQSRDLQRPLIRPTVTTAVLLGAVLASSIPIALSFMPLRARVDFAINTASVRATSKMLRYSSRLSGS